MEVLRPRCAGLDVHKESVVACARLVDGSKVRLESQTFKATVKGLTELSDWLESLGVTDVAMEATGIYWKPVWHVLEETFAITLANAHHVKNVPGRKTDVNDAAWLADLHAHGLIRASFVPPRPIQELRALTRTRKQLVREKVQHVNRIQKTLEDAGIKLASVASDILGKSALAVLKAIGEGETDAEKLADLTAGRLKAKREDLVEALHGHPTERHRFLLKLHLNIIDTLEMSIDAVEAEVDSHLDPFRSAVELLMTIPGVSETTAHAIVSEVGVDMSRFPTPANLVSWAGLCPRSDESAGKRRSTRIRKGAPWLKTVLAQAAKCATRQKGSYLQAQYWRIRGRRGPNKATIAVASSILKASYFILRDGVPYRELGGDYFNQRDKTKTISRLVRRLRELGQPLILLSAPTVAAPVSL